jgi:hypothetical protein
VVTTQGLATNPGLFHLEPRGEMLSTPSPAALENSKMEPLT